MRENDTPVVYENVKFAPGICCTEIVFVSFERGFSKDEHTYHSFRKENNMKRILLLVGIALSGLILLQCSQNPPTSPDMTEDSPSYQTDNGGHPGGTVPVIQTEEDGRPGGGP
jgi:hypothetical protein